MLNNLCSKPQLCVALQIKQQEIVSLTLIYNILALSWPGHEPFFGNVPHTNHMKLYLSTRNCMNLSEKGQELGAKIVQKLP